MSNILYFCKQIIIVMLSQSSVILETVSELAQGGTILYPTDTIWGLGCDATNADAVEKIYSIKQRDHSKSMLILCSDIDMVERYVAPVSDKVGELLLGSDRPTTVIMPLCKSLLANNLAAADGTVGVRIPKMDFCQQLLRTFERPIVSTSANLSGCPSPASFVEIDESLKQAVDHCVSQSMEEHSGGSSSQIVKLQQDGSILVLRK